MTWEQAVEALFRAPHGSFVDERKRLAGELRTAGDKAGAAKLNKLGRPPASAWAVNQAWWRARDEFNAVLSTALQVRSGDVAALATHKAAIAAVRKRAAEFLKEIGNAAAENTLQKVETTLTALAATGGFDPDPPGALTDDRAPAGFAALGIAPVVPGAVEAPPAPPPSTPRKTLTAIAEATSRASAELEAQRDELKTERDREVAAAAEAEAQARRAREEAEQREAIREQARRTAELGAARTALKAAEDEVAALEAKLQSARTALALAKDRLATLEQK
ncbi:MAG: hypothetical protein U0228_15900 [Myxococcaceae bacterium]